MLTLRSYLGAKLPHWLMTKWLPCLVELDIINCSAIKELTVFPSSLGQLYISGCTSLESLECLSPQNLPVIKIISIVNCDKLESLPVEKLSGFSFLEVLIISYCPKLICSQKLMLPSSLKTLALKACCGINCSLPGSLFNVASLTKLEITHCPHRTSLLWCPIIKLDELIVSDCEELEWLERLGDPLRLKKLSIIRCPKLRVNEMLTPECGENGTIALQLSELAVSDISILRSPVLRNAIPCIKKLTIDGSNVVKLLTPECGESGTIALQLSELAVSDISILRSPVLRNAIPCIKELTIYGSNVVTLFTGEDNEILEQFVSLEQLMFNDCANLQLLELPNLNSLKSLKVYGSPELKLVSDKGLPSLQRVGCDNLTDCLWCQEFIHRNFHK
ncbi:hypothetical protein LUZ60_005990 [Juncus effusus]|nr:hypothetical protein LUZ60_005990 [Juncus effusus]